MCGLLGIAGGGIIQRDLNFLKDLLIISQIRGEDATGFAQGAIRRNHIHYFIDKDTMNASDYMYYHVKKKEGHNGLLDNITDNFYLGHVRAATRGAYTVANAHPFDLDTIIGMHNGTLKEHKYQDKTKTDSELMFEDMDKRGVKEVLSDLETGSAFAIVVLNKDTNELIFARNEDRPLNLAWNKHRDVLYWASESEMLHWIMRRHNIEHHGVYSASPGYLHTLKINDINHSKKNPPWRLEKIPSKPLFTVRDSRAATQSPVVLLKDLRKIKEHKDRITEPLRVSNKKGNITLPLVPGALKGPRIKSASLHRDCDHCGKDLSLVDQYFGSRNKDGSKYLCSPCSLTSYKAKQKQLWKNLNRTC